MTALGYALTGEELELDDALPVQPATIVAALEQAGWARARIGDHARAVVAAELPWPHPVPGRLRPASGAAQFLALLGAVRAELGLLTLEQRPPSTRTRLTPDEQRLLREVPPHHGS